MKKFFAAVAAFTFLTNAGIAFAQEKVLGLSVDQLFESRVGVNNAIKAEAEKLGYKVVEVVADGDAQQQNAQVQSLVTQGVSAILVCAVDQNTIERALIAAERAGIPVVAYDRDLPGSKAVDAFVGPDSVSDGRLAGQLIAEKLQGAKGDVAVLELLGALNDQNGIDRSKGFNEAVAENAHVKVLQIPTDWASDRALSGTQNAFQANPAIAAVFAATDTHIPAVETVLTDLGKLKKAGEEGHVVVAGINGSNDGYTATVKGIADGFVVMDLATTGTTAVQLADKLIKGEAVEKVTRIPGILYTTDTAEANKDKIWGAK
ncbi:sugar ABC transporter substrate-binding protein [Shinella sp. 838]|uniref:sugar ABC transporter substrate-binding protein n=1 Tax=Shinella sp. 838 TaxID=3038164 RepID=UPI0024152290|nr:sugar ABC transporter substrate-binding protein [Shinella sp. 838]MDG4674933.1 sugar ABC transporter substrate-binding protein [Shinella sp. 838]